MPRKGSGVSADVLRFHADNPDVTHAEIAALFGVSRQRIGQIIHGEPYRARQIERQRERRAERNGRLPKEPADVA